MEAAVANATPAFNATNANVVGQCQLCRSMRQTAHVKFARNIGMLVLRQTRRLEANLCKTCASKEFWNFQGMNLLLGPWGVISLIITPIYLVTNTVSYVAAQRELKGAVE
jgi:hypothetical protein